LYERTQRSPIVIPVINVIGKGVQTTVKTSSNGGSNGTSPEEKAKEDAISQARRFARLRQQLLGQEAYKN
jgi:hypothetical protein